MQEMTTFKNVFTYNTADDDGAAVEEGHLGLQLDSALLARLLLYSVSLHVHTTNQR
jgi:hypothetical protein